MIKTFADRTTEELFRTGSARKVPSEIARRALRQLSSATTTEFGELMTSIPNTRPLERPPIHPGEIPREEFLPAYGLTVTALAEAAGVSRQSMNKLLRERRAVSPEMALRLGRLFGMSAEFWLNLQRNVDVWNAARGLKQELAKIHPIEVAERADEADSRWRARVASRFGPCSLSAAR